MCSHIVDIVFRMYNKSRDFRKTP